MSEMGLDRRSFLKAVGSAGVLTAMSESAYGLHSGIVHEVAESGQVVAAKSGAIRFSVIGLDHYHIMGMTAAVIRGGGQLVSVYSVLPKAIADFLKLYPQAKVAKSEDEILNDPSIQLVAGA